MRYVFGCLLLTVGCLVVPWAADAAETGRLHLYLEVPEVVAVPTGISLGGLICAGPVDTVRLEPLVPDLNAAELAGRQVLLARADLPAGEYTTLILEIGAVETLVGSAPVSPEVPAGGFPLSIDLMLPAGGSEAVFLVWRPGSRPLDENGAWVPAMGAEPMPVPPLGSLAFVTCGEAGLLVAVDRDAGRVVGLPRIGEDPRGLVYSRQQQKLYVALAGDDAVAVVDGLSLRLERAVPLQFGDEPERLALSRDGEVLWVLNRGSRTLAAVNIWSMQERFRTAVGDDPRDLAVDPETGHVYVACAGEGQVQIVDSGGGGVMGALTPTSMPVAVTIDESTRMVFVGSGSQRRIFGFDLREGKDLGSLGICGPVVDLVQNPRSRQVFAAVPMCREISVTRLEAGLEFAALSMPSAPSRLTFDAEHRQLLVLFTKEGTLAVCHPDRGTVQDLVRVGDEPYGVVAP